MAERSADWIAQAHRDLESARWQIEGGFPEWACFAAQQAAEKAVKAVVSKLGGTAWGHSVGELLLGLRERVNISDDIVALGHGLDRFYVPARYPNGWQTGAPHDFFTKEDAERAIRDSEQLIRICDDLLAG